MTKTDPADEFTRSLAQLLRARNEEIGITFDDLAESSGVVRSTVSRVLYGERDIGVATLRRLSRVLELKMSALFGEAEEKLAG